MFCGPWDLGGKSGLKENFGLGVFKGGCRAVSSLSTSLALCAAWIFVDVFGLLSVYRRRERLGGLGAVAGYGTAHSDSEVLGPGPRQNTLLCLS